MATKRWPTMRVEKRKALEWAEATIGDVADEPCEDKSSS